MTCSLAARGRWPADLKTIATQKALEMWKLALEPATNEFPLCSALFAIIIRTSSCQPSRAPSAVLFEFVAKIGYQIVSFTSEVKEPATSTRAQRVFRVSISLVKPGQQAATFVQHGVATKTKLAKQLAAIKHIEQVLHTAPDALFLLLNKVDKEHIGSSLLADPAPWKLLLKRIDTQRVERSPPVQASATSGDSGRSQASPKALAALHELRAVMDPKAAASGQPAEQLKSTSDTTASLLSSSNTWPYAAAERQGSTPGRGSLSQGANADPPRLHGARCTVGDSKILHYDLPAIGSVDGPAHGGQDVMSRLTATFLKHLHQRVSDEERMLDCGTVDVVAKLVINTSALTTCAENAIPEEGIPA